MPRVRMGLEQHAEMVRVARPLQHPGLLLEPVLQHLEHASVPRVRGAHVVACEVVGVRRYRVVGRDHVGPHVDPHRGRVLAGDARALLVHAVECGRQCSRHADVAVGERGSADRCRGRRVGWRCGRPVLPRHRRPQRGVRREELVQDRRPRAWAAGDDDGRDHTPVVDRRIGDDTRRQTRATLQEPQDHLAHPPSTDDVEIGLLDRPDQHRERLRERVAAEVVGRGPEDGFGDELLGVERLRRDGELGAALAVDRVPHPQGSGARFPAHTAVLTVDATRGRTRTPLPPCRRRSRAARRRGHRRTARGDLLRRRPRSLGVRVVVAPHQRLETGDVAVVDRDRVVHERRVRLAADQLARQQRQLRPGVHAVVVVDRVGLGHDPTEPRRAGLDGDDAEVGEPVERAARGEREHHHRPVELRAEEVVDDRATGPAHDARLVAGAGVEREREPELLRRRPRTGRTSASLYGVDGNPRREEERPEPGRRRGAAPRRSPRRCRASAPPDGEQWWRAAERVGGPVVVRAAQLRAGARHLRTRSTPGARTSGRSPRRSRRRALGRGCGRRGRQSPTIATLRSSAVMSLRGSQTLDEQRAPAVLRSRCAGRGRGSARRPARRTARWAR